MLAWGLVIGLALIAGSWLEKRIVVRLDLPAFICAGEVLLAASGILMVMGI